MTICDREIEILDKHIALTKQGFEQMDKRFNQMFAYFTTGIVLLGVLITSFQIFG